MDKSGRHVSADQLANTLRANRDGTEFEVICDRQRNNDETSLNSFGNIFTSDNDDDGNRGCRVISALDGGHFGYHTPGSPRHWGEDVPGNVPKLVGTGNGSPAGILVYEGNLLPREYFGSVLEVDAGTRQVNFFPLTRKGAAFRTEYKVFLSSERPLVPTRRCLHGPRWLGLRRRLVRRRRWRPCLQRSDDRPDLPGRARGEQDPESECRLWNGRGIDQRRSSRQPSRPRMRLDEA